MALDAAAAVVTGPGGQSQSLGEFIRARKRACGLPVTRIVEAAGISRANYYLLEKDSQRPSLTTLVRLFDAMGLETRLPVAQGSSHGADLEVLVGEHVYKVEVRWSDEERSRSRDRYLSAASIGLGVALDVLPILGRRPVARQVGITGGSRGGAAITAAASLGPLIGPALGAAARLLRERRDANEAEAAAAPSQEQVLEDLKETAASMSTEELEALLAAMKAMRGDLPDHSEA